MRLGFLGRAHLFNVPPKLSPYGFSLLDRWCLSCLLEGGLLERVVEVGVGPAACEVMGFPAFHNNEQS